MSIFRLLEDPETCDLVEDRMATAIDPNAIFPTSLLSSMKGDSATLIIWVYTMNL